MPVFALPTILGLLQKVPAVLAGSREFIDAFQQIKSTFSEKDQAVLQASYDRLVAENDAGHARLQDKLAKAAKR